MKKAKVYIITHKRKAVLNKTLSQLFSTDLGKIENTEVNVINNHTDFHLNPEFKSKVRVLHNTLRPDSSTGHLAENYNQALMDGFKDLNNPDSELVIHMQNDIVLHQNWFANLQKMHEKYSFVVGRYGDNIASYTPDAVKKIGLWDERLMGVDHKEGDYWISALVYNKEKSCINDLHHKRLINHRDALPLDIGMQHDAEWRELKREHQRNLNTSLLCYRVFCEKWKGSWKTDPALEGWLRNWPQEFIDTPPSIPLMPYYMKYPYFEKDIENLYTRNIVGFRNEKVGPIPKGKDPNDLWS